VHLIIRLLLIDDQSIEEKVFPIINNLTLPWCINSFDSPMDSQFSERLFVKFNINEIYLLISLLKINSVGPDLIS